MTAARWVILEAFGIDVISHIQHFDIRQCSTSGIYGVFYDGSTLVRTFARRKEARAWIFGYGGDFEPTEPSGCEPPITDGWCVGPPTSEVH